VIPLAQVAETTLRTTTSAQVTAVGLGLLILAVAVALMERYVGGREGVAAAPDTAVRDVDDNPLPERKPIPLPPRDADPEPSGNTDPEPSVEHGTFTREDVAPTPLHEAATEPATHEPAFPFAPAPAAAPPVDAQPEAPEEPELPPAGDQLELEHQPGVSAAPLADGESPPGESRP